MHVTVSGKIQGPVIAEILAIPTFPGRRYLKLEAAAFFYTTNAKISTLCDFFLLIYELHT